jgi:hypothetical protein
VAAAFESPELIDLFTTYTAGPSSIGAHLADAAARQTRSNPLIVATGTDIALFPGDGAMPTVMPYRLSTRGFKELAAVSHLGPAVATLAHLREVDPTGEWRADSERLLATCKAARSANSVQLWRDQIAVRAFAGREPAIAAMVDYSCSLTERVLARSLDEPSYLTMSNLEHDYLDGPHRELTVPFNRVMVATFFLTGMDFAHRLIAWFDELDIGWGRAMVIIAGRSGRPTAGVTRESNSVAGVVHAASRRRLPDDRMFIAPHATTFAAYDGTNIRAAASIEGEYRRLWAALYATSELGGRMFSNYPPFRPRSSDRIRVDERTMSVHEKPAIGGPDDWFALVTRLRVVMEDPQQLLSGAVTDYACSQLIKSGNDPANVIVPGLDGEPYPHLNEES